VVLAVDEDASARGSVAAALPRRYQFIGLPDGSEFMETVEAYEPDLVILGRNLPGEGGRSLSRRLRGRAEFRHIPVLFLSKTFDERTLRKTIVRLVGRG